MWTWHARYICCRGTRCIVGVMVDMCMNMGWYLYFSGELALTHQREKERIEREQWQQHMMNKVC